MDNIYSVLNVSENASKEELKAAFIAWKKPRQQILRTGTREEQAQASAEISKMTILYKEACSVSDSLNTKGKTTDNVRNNETNSTTEKIFSSSTLSTHSKINSQSHININENPSSPTPPVSFPTYSESSPQKILNILFCIAIIAFGCAILYLYNKDKNSSIYIPPVVQNKPQNTNTPNMTSNNDLSSEKNTSSPVEIKLVQEAQNKPIVEDKNVGKTSAQRGAIQTLLDFHENITKKSFRQAYDCMSYDLQNQISYEGWTPGFNTTVSSVPSNIKIVSESENRIVLTYDLTAIDNPGGQQTFAGTVVIIKTSEGWKIDDVINKPK